MQVNTETKGPKRYRVTIDGEDVSDRCRWADDASGQVELLKFTQERPAEDEWGRRDVFWGGYFRRWFHDHRGYCRFVNGYLEMETRKGVVTIEELPLEPGDLERYEAIMGVKR